METINLILEEITNIDDTVNNKLIVIEELVNKFGDDPPEGITKRMLAELRLIDKLLKSKLVLLEEIFKAAPKPSNYIINTKEDGAELWKETEGSLIFARLLSTHLNEHMHIICCMPKCQE